MRIHDTVIRILTTDIKMPACSTQVMMMVIIRVKGMMVVKSTDKIPVGLRRFEETSG